ncbi:MAG: hypothetical protein AMJ61_09040 [Desulfobacterales bacterium SG8_35_2]|nr:MAG: hypothetical protein AMJ61_09040 [Desulfobacterales bacterium SG8_35_2]
MQVSVYKESAHIVAVVLLAVFVGFCINFNAKLGIILAIFPATIYILLSNKKNALYLILLFLPFHASPFISENLLGIPGAKPHILLSFLILFACFYHGGHLLFQPGDPRKKVIIYLGVYYAIFSLALFRSLDYLQLLYMSRPELFDSSAISYVLSYYVKPSLFIVSFIYILNHISSQEETEKILHHLCVVLGVLSTVVILISLSHGTIFMPRAYTTEIWNYYFGLHYNDIGSIYIILAPLLIIPISRKSLWGVLNWCLALLALALLQSRTSLLVFLLGSMMVLYFLGKKKGLFILLFFLFLISLYFLPGFIKETLQTGFKSGDLNQIFTGRINSIWIPLLLEWVDNFGLLLFGKGLFAMIASSAYQKGMILDTSMAHNAFIEFFLDNGIMLFLLIVFFLIKLLKLAWKNVRQINSDIGWALFASIICYLIATITGQKIYPSNYNMFLFPIIALLVNYISFYKPLTNDTGAPVKQVAVD